MPMSSSGRGAIEFDGKIYVPDCNCLYCYDPDNDSWSTKANRSASTTTLLAESNKRLFAIERNWTVHQYDANQNIWTTVIDFNENDNSYNIFPF